jgi:hypothetical protein
MDFNNIQLGATIIQKTLYFHNLEKLKSLLCPLIRLEKNLRFELVTNNIIWSFGFIQWLDSQSTNDCTVLFNLCNHGR